MANHAPPDANRNPGALAGATGAKANQTSHHIDTAPSALSQERYQVVADAVVTLCYAGSQRFAATIAWAALHELTEDNRARVIDYYAPRHAGQPITPFSGIMAEAELWAEMAGEDELAAYAFASFRAMPTNRQAAFLRHVGGEVLA